jgi:hypothetical protein
LRAFTYKTILTNGQQQEDFITEKKGILNVLLKSKEDQTVVGILSKVLGEGIHITVVVELTISELNSTIIHLNPVDTSGSMLKTSRLRLSDIEAVFPFRSPYKNPFLGRI